MLLRLVPITAVLGFGLFFLLLLRLPERACHGACRPWTPFITQITCRIVLALMGLRVIRTGHPATGAGIAVANHASWIDIFVLNAFDRPYFVAKSEVSSWPGIGLLAKAVGTMFIRRARQDASRQAEQFRHRIEQGQRLLIFPEGTSTDGSQVLSFKSTVFAAIFILNEGRAKIQPVTLRYAPPSQYDPRFLCWWGDMSFGAHMLSVLSRPMRGIVRLHYHPALDCADFPDRKALAKRAEHEVRQKFSEWAPAAP